MKSWILSIVGVVFLSVLFDLIYPKGKTNNLCKSIFGIFAAFVMISPLLKIDFNNINLVGDMDTTLIENINKSKEEALELKIYNHLKDCNIDGVNVKIDSNLSQEFFEIEKVYIDSTNLVLTEKITNINKYEVITTEIAELLEIDKEKVVVYG